MLFQKATICLRNSQCEYETEPHDENNISFEISHKEREEVPLAVKRILCRADIQATQCDSLEALNNREIQLLTECVNE